MDKPRLFAPWCTASMADRAGNQKRGSIITPPDADNILFLTGDAAGCDSPGLRVGDLDLVLRAKDTHAPFAVLDTAPRSLRASGRLLLEHGGALSLVGPGSILSQDGAKAGPFVTDLAAGPVRAVLGDLSPLRALMVIGTGIARTRHLSLTDDEDKTRARADLTTLYPDGGGRALTIAVLHGLRGYDRALQALRSHLQAAGSDANPSPADCPDLMFPGHPDYTTKPAVPILANNGAGQTATRIIAAHLAAARQAEAGIIADHDTEFLHDYRVALRKIRSVISLFKGVYSPDQTAMLKRAFSDLMAPTGRLRDLDVYLLSQDDYRAMLPPGLHDGLAVMFDMLARERSAQHRRIKAHLASPAYRASVRQLEDLMAGAPGPAPGPRADQAVGTYARTLIWKRYRKVCALAAQITDRTPDAQIHELRIACKKLRYLIEFFAPLYPAPDLKTLIKPLKGLQDNLGLFNDYSVQQQALRGFMDRHDPIGHKQDLMLAQTVGALIATLHARQGRERARVMASFSRFDGPGIRRVFRTLFHDKET